MEQLTFGSLFAGIGGFDKGFEDAGMRCAWQVEKDASARSVLARHWPDVPRHDDVCGVGAHNLAPVDVICGGFPCQDLSVAGRRAGFGGERSVLFYEMARICDELRPAYLVWENVPGLLSSRGGRDFLAVLMELERIGYYGCWTTLDAQFFGVAQRRQRVFGVFARRDIGASRCAEVLALAARLPWNTAKGGTARQGVAASVTASAGHHGHSSPRRDGSDNLIPFDTTQITSRANRSTARPGAPCHPLSASAHVPAIAQSNRGHSTGDTAETLRAGSHGALPMVAGAQSARNTRNSGEDTFVPLSVALRGREGGATAELGGEQATALRASQGGGDKPHVLVGFNFKGSYQAPGEDIAPTMTHGGTGGGTSRLAVSSATGVRRLTPRECERLQGFPDDWTAGQPDSTRYRQLGNAVCRNVAAWLGAQIVRRHR